jgi:hypothetical protein
MNFKIWKTEAMNVHCIEVRLFFILDISSIKNASVVSKQKQFFSCQQCVFVRTLEGTHGGKYQS